MILNEETCLNKARDVSKCEDCETCGFNPVEDFKRQELLAKEYYKDEDGIFRWHHKNVAKKPFKKKCGNCIYLDRDVKTVIGYECTCPSIRRRNPTSAFKYASTPACIRYERLL